jgi:CheY-like chemotaxis protein
MFGLLRKKERVLLLDDDPAVQRLVSALLRRAGLRVQVVGKGNEAIAALKSGDFGAILLDLMMPHEGGMTVIAHLRDHDPKMLRRVIVLTATPGSVLTSLAREVAAIVHKPFAPEALVETVNRVVALA